MTARPRARRTSPLYMPSAFDLFKPSRDLILNNLNIFGPLYILPFFFWIHSWIDTPASSGHWLSRASDANYSWSGFSAAYFAILIGFSILWLIIVLAGGTINQIMTQRAQLDIIEDKRPSFKKLWVTAKELGWRMLGLYIAIVVLIICTLGIFSRRYILAPYVMLEKKCSIGEALSESHRLSNINPGAVWGIIGVMILIGLCGIVPIIGSLASFVLGASYSIAPALRYQQLKKLS